MLGVGHPDPEASPDLWRALAAADGEVQPTIIEFDPGTLQARRDGEVVDRFDSQRSRGEFIFRRMAYLAASLGLVDRQDEPLPLIEHVGEAGVQMLEHTGVRMYGNQGQHLARLRDIVGEETLTRAGQRIGGRDAYILNRPLAVFIRPYVEVDS